MFIQPRLSGATISRRFFAAALVGSPLLAACGTGALTPASIVAEAGTLANGLLGAVKAVAAADPALIPANLLATIETDLGLAQSAVGSLSANAPATSGASTVQTINGWINAVLNTLAAPPINGLIPAPFNMAVAAAAIVVPDLEAFVDQYLPTAAAAAPAAARARAMLVLNAPPVAAAGATRAQEVAAALAVLQGYAR